MVFVKGQSGNPGGRPKREWTWSGLLADAVEEELTTKDGVKDNAKSFITKRLVRMAIDGDIQAQKEIMNRMDGMPKQSIEHSGDEDSPIRIDITTTLKKAYGQRVTKTTGEVPKDGK